MVLDRLDLRLDPDDRIALLGANGNGKSTFAKLLAGELAPLAGEVIRAPKLRVGYFAQHQIEALRPEDSALQHLARRLPAEREERLRTRLGGFGLTQDKADLPAGVLSGGEKARLTFALISAAAPQFLVLDEPTNHLDIDAREALIQAINDFAGAVLLISHDPHLIELTADRLWLVEGGRWRPFDGDLDDYRRALLERGADQARRRAGAGRATRAARNASARPRARPPRAAAPGGPRGRARAGAPERGAAALAAKLADGATYARSGDEIAALIRREAELKAAIEAAEQRRVAALPAVDWRVHPASSPRRGPQKVVARRFRLITRPSARAATSGSRDAVLTPDRSSGGVGPYWPLSRGNFTCPPPSITIASYVSARCQSPLLPRATDVVPLRPESPC